MSTHIPTNSSTTEEAILINRHAHGHVSLPIILARRGDHSLIQEIYKLNSGDRKSICNEGHFRVCLKVLLTLGWVHKDNNKHYTQTQKSSQELYLLNRSNTSFVLGIYGLSSDRLELYLRNDPYSPLSDTPHLSPEEESLISRSISESTQNWKIPENPLLTHFLDGVVIIPVFMLLFRCGIIPKDPDMPILYGSSIRGKFLVEFLTGKGFSVVGPDGNTYLTKLGCYAVSHSSVYATVSSYRPLLAEVSSLLFNNPGEVLNYDWYFMNTGDSESGLPDFRFSEFSGISEFVTTIFNLLLPEERPQYICDVGGTGGGNLLRFVYETAKNRGLSEPPLILLGTRNSERKTQYPLNFRILRMDMRDPDMVITEFQKNGINIRDVLFLWGEDANRRYMTEKVDRTGEVERSCSVSDTFEDDEEVVVVANDGGVVSIKDARLSLVEHLRWWSNIIYLSRGILLLEPHSLPAVVASKHIDVCSSLWHDAVSSFSKEHLERPDVFLMALAETGLFPKDFKKFFRRFPEELTFTQSTLSWLEKKPFSIRYAAKGDLLALVELDELCWEPQIRTPLATLDRRILENPAGNFVIEKDGKVVGVLYTHRINSTKDLNGKTAAEEHLFRAVSGTILQLLAESVHPLYQDQGLGYFLLELVLSIASLDASLEQVVAVTRCKNYGRVREEGLRQEDYIHTRFPGTMRLVDPILHYHESHGAMVDGLQYGYRPGDAPNDGNGVLIRYDIRKRVTETGRKNSGDTSTSTSETSIPMHILSQTLPVLSPKEVHQTVIDIIRLLSIKKETTFSPTIPLVAMGLDSLDLMELHEQLVVAVGMNIDPTIFFSFPTAEAIGNYLAQQKTVVGAEGRSSRKRNVPHTSLVSRTLGLQDSSDLLESMHCTNSILVEQTEPKRTILNNIKGSVPTVDPQMGHRHVPSDKTAIVGMACRFPKANTPEAFWKLLENGVNAIDALPAGHLRRNQEDQDMSQIMQLEKNGTSIPSYGGYVQNVDLFDSKFFGISPREATNLDPQHRLLLEVSWEALERAAVDPNSLKETPTGVFVGGFTHDYEILQLSNMENLEDVNAYFSIGSSFAASSGRLSYFFGTQGPAISLDTACSSSLVAVHIARRSLECGDCNLALAGGINLILSPVHTLSFSQSNMLSRDGRCKTFDAAANGYVRSEGCAVLVLRRLDNAIEVGDDVLAVLVASTVNQDGNSNGFTAPNGLAQENLYRTALESAGLNRDDIDYIEAHGTGTPLGDPVEFNSLRAVYGGRKEPLVLGSVKTNIGHTEAVSGLAGIIKVVLSLCHQSIPAHLHLDQVNSLIALNSIPAIIPKQLMHWNLPLGRKVRRGAVSSFGFTGTNAHVIIEEAMVTTRQHSLQKHLLTLSAKNDQRLLEKIGKLRNFLEISANVDMGNLAYTFNMKQPQLIHPSIILQVADISELLYHLKNNTYGRRERVSQSPHVAFLFTGLGSQHPNMGRKSYETYPVFRCALDECTQEMVPYLGGRSLLDIIFIDGDNELKVTALNHTIYAYPAIFAVEYAMTRLWESWGVIPDYLFGTSVGEYVAATIAGILSLRDAVRIVCLVAQLVQSVPEGNGGMILIASNIDKIMRILRKSNTMREHKNPVEIAAVINSMQVLISGDTIALSDAFQVLREENVICTWVNIMHALNSAMMEPILEKLEEIVSSVSYQLPIKHIVMSLTGNLLLDKCNGEYWKNQIRKSTNWEKGIKTLHKEGCNVFLEIQPDTCKVEVINEEKYVTEKSWLVVGQKNNINWMTTLDIVSTLWIHGVNINWNQLDKQNKKKNYKL